VPPLHQLADPLRRLPHDHFHDLRVAQFAARRQRVGDMILEPVLRVHDPRDSALGVGAVRFVQPVLGDHQRRLRGVHGNRRPQPRQTAANDQHIGEEVRHLLGMKRNQIAGNWLGHEVNLIKQGLHQGLRRTEFNIRGDATFHNIGRSAAKIEFCTSEPGVASALVTIADAEQVGKREFEAGQELAGVAVALL
jgi:hypothetical protein